MEEHIIFFILMTLLANVAADKSYMSRHSQFNFSLGLESPFNVVWNTPTESCRKFGIDVDVANFGIMENGISGWKGSYITIFYGVEMGLYPYFDAKTGKVVNGGIPQLTNLTDHFRKATKDIENYIPDPKFQGLGVIDWESWRPIWERNYDKMNIYRNASKDLVHKQHPKWSQKRIEAEAKKQFETAALKLMVGTLELARRLRPRGWWGFYNFPTCYNYKGSKFCSAKNIELNNQLHKLFASANAFLPSIYLNNNTVQHNRNRIYGEIEESMRIRNAMLRNETLPVYAYDRFRYATGGWYSKVDIYNSVSQAALLGSNGLIIWDDHNLGHNASICNKTKDFIDTLLGPVVQATLNFTKSCSKVLCNDHGRCFLKDLINGELLTNLSNIASAKHLFASARYDGDQSLRTNEYSGIIGNDLSETSTMDFHQVDLKRERILMRVYKTYISGSVLILSSQTLKEEFGCLCYPAWEGNVCQRKKSD